MAGDYNQYSLKAVLEKCEGEIAILKTEDGQKISWPKKDLPAGLKIGYWFKLVIKTEEVSREEKEAQAKSLLNEILKDNL